jgi:hypothetical protein
VRSWVLFALAACGSSQPPHTARWTLGGDLGGVRSADDTQGGRSSCAAARDDDGLATLTLFFTTAAGEGLHVTLTGFDGAGRYGLGSGTALVYDLGDLLECGRSAKRCYSGPDCTVTVDDWNLGETLPGARGGVAHGSVACTVLENDRRGRVSVADGTFSCRATDWR